jgi:hypothetical protein
MNHFVKTVYLFPIPRRLIIAGMRNRRPELPVIGFKEKGGKTYFVVSLIWYAFGLRIAR